MNRNTISFDAKFTFGKYEYHMRVYPHAGYNGKPVLVVTRQGSSVAVGQQYEDGSWDMTGGRKTIFDAACKFYEENK